MPAVAAVHSGSALANSSSLRCLRNSPAGNGTAVPRVLTVEETEPILYLRIPLTVTSRVDPNNSSLFEYRYYVAFTDLESAARTYGVTFSTSTLVGNNRFRRFNEIANQFDGNGKGDPLGHIQQSSWSRQDWLEIPRVNHKRAVLILSPDGKQIVGVGKVTVAGNVATNSCWTSFVPGP